MAEKRRNGTGLEVSLSVRLLSARGGLQERATLARVLYPSRRGLAARAQGLELIAFITQKKKKKKKKRLSRALLSSRGEHDE